MNRFKPITREMTYLFPPSMHDWLPEQHLARFIVEIVEQLDVQPMVRAYGTSGSAPFHPAVLLSILVYGYATGVFSSRKLEHATYDSVAFRFVAADEHPDHDTLNTFRKRFLKEIAGLMVQVLLIARTFWVLQLGNIALDGSKLKANASKHNALSYGHIKKLEAQLHGEVKKLMAEVLSLDLGRCLRLEEKVDLVEHWCQDNVAERNATVITLQHDRAISCLMTIERSSSDSWDFFVCDHSLIVQPHCHHAPEEGDI
jgi:transposase